MEILQTIWNALLTQNEGIIKFLLFPLSLLENAVGMLLFTTLLNIQSNKKQKLIYILITSTFSTLSSLLIPTPFNAVINILILIISILIIFKPNILKSFIAIIIPFIVTVLFEMLSSQIFTPLFQMPYNEASLVPLYRLIAASFVYFCIFILYLVIKRLKLNISILDNLRKKDKVILIGTTILGFIAIYMQLYITFLYSSYLPLPITILSMIILVAYFFISLYSLTKTNKLQIANQDIENLQLYNKTLSIMHDNIRAFKHDFNNIVQAIGRIYCNR